MDLTQYPSHKRQQLLQRLEVRSLPGYDVLDPPGQAPLGDIRLLAKLHHERPLGRER